MQCVTTTRGSPHRRGLSRLWAEPQLRAIAQAISNWTGRDQRTARDHPSLTPTVANTGWIPSDRAGQIDLHALPGHPHSGDHPDQLADGRAGPHRPADQQLLGRVIGNRPEQHATLLGADHLLASGPRLHRRGKRFPTAVAVLAPPRAHRPRRHPEHRCRLRIRSRQPRLQRGHHPGFRAGRPDARRVGGTFGQGRRTIRFSDRHCR